MKEIRSVYLGTKREGGSPYLLRHSEAGRRRGLPPAERAGPEDRFGFNKRGLNSSYRTRLRSRPQEGANPFFLSNPPNPRRGKPETTTPNTREKRKTCKSTSNPPGKKKMHSGTRGGLVARIGGKSHSSAIGEGGQARPCRSLSYA